MRRLYQQVADELRARIHNEQYAVGQRMPAERLLADEFNVSRPTIREAIIALEIAGFVEVKVGSGVHVTSKNGNSTTPDELDVGPFELMEARLITESKIAELAAERISDVQIARLEELVHAMAHENEIGTAGESADREFHLTIAQASQNSALADVAERLWSFRESSPMVVEMLNRSRAYGVQPLIEDHRQIVKALKNRDAKAAHEAMYNHLTRVIDALLEVTETDAIEQAMKDARSRRAKYIRSSA